MPQQIKDRLYATRMKAIAARKPEKVRIQKQVLAGTRSQLDFWFKWNIGYRWLDCSSYRPCVWPYRYCAMAR
ncbi:hypothetical protein [Polynucleobacter necessarius]|uniref:hypothetical protein n=1 Tax=Polynucleobacter necessarius TaxID=576610 RepID=UPI0039E5D136